MTLPLNGYSELKGQQVQERTGGAPVPPDRSPEDWPDWSDAEETERKPNQPVQIQIRPATDSPGEPIGRPERQEEEEPWDDFEEEEVTSDQSPTTPLPVPREKATGGSQLSGMSQGSKALKLASAPKAAPLPPSRDASWDMSWEQADKAPSDTAKPKVKSLADTVKPKGVGGGGGGGLGEEFTIMVKKKQENDPELDFFADMEPDIKLSSTAGSLLLASLSTGTSNHSVATESLPAMSASDLPDTKPAASVLSLTAKFAAEDVSEVSVLVASNY